MVCVKCVVPVKDIILSAPLEKFGTFSLFKTLSPSPIFGRATYAVKLAYAIIKRSGARLCPSGDIQPVDRNWCQKLLPVSGASFWRQKPARVTWA